MNKHCRYGNNKCLRKGLLCNCKCYTDCDYVYDTSFLPKVRVSTLKGKWYKLVYTFNHLANISNFNTRIRISEDDHKHCPSVKATTLRITDGLFKKFTVCGKLIPLNDCYGIFSLNLDNSCIKPNFIVIYIDDNFLISTCLLRNSVEIWGRNKSIGFDCLKMLITFLTNSCYDTSNLVFTFQTNN